MKKAKIDQKQGGYLVTLYCIPGYTEIIVVTLLEAIELVRKHLEEK